MPSRANIERAIRINRRHLKEAEQWLAQNLLAPANERELYEGIARRCEERIAELQKRLEEMA